MLNMVTRINSMHPDHLLVQLQNPCTKEYICGGCKTDGQGTNFGCEPCNFHMHDFCSNCPITLLSFLHPDHPLTLMINNTASPRICDVCGDGVDGLFYWCGTCNFNVHPLCSQFPQSLYHAVLHNPHRLIFQKPYKPAACLVCGDVCNSWRYRCGYCDGFDVHMDCVANLHDAKSYETTSRRLPPSAGLYSYGTGVSPTANSYNNMYTPPCANYQAAPQYNMYNPYGGVPFSVHPHMLYNPYGVVPHGTCAHQPYNTNPGALYNPYNGAPFDSNSQHWQNHHGDASCNQAPAHNAQTTGQGSAGKRVLKIFSILGGLALNVAIGAILL